jgi:hypothetical protein
MSARSKKTYRDNKTGWWDTYKFLKEVPSPVSLDYPYRNLTRIVGATPSSLDTTDLKERINSYFEDIKKQSTRPSPIRERRQQIADDFRKLQDEIATAYVQDIAPNAKYPAEVMSKILEKYKIPKSSQDRVSLDMTGEDNLGTAEGITKILPDNSIWINVLNDLEDPRSVTYHETLHAIGELNHGYLGQEEYVGGAYVPQGNPNAFELANEFNSTYHHVPYKDSSAGVFQKERNLPATLVGPFYQAGATFDPTIWEKLMSKIKDSLNQQ